MATIEVVSVFGTLDDIDRTESLPTPPWKTVTLTPYDRSADSDDDEFESSASGLSKPAQAVLGAQHLIDCREQPGPRGGLRRE